MKKILLISVLFAGCASNIPLTSTINDFVLMGIKFNNSDEISFQFESSIKDTTTKPYTQGKEKEISSSLGFNHTESFTLGKMLKEYMSNKFMNMTEDGPVVIKVSLQDFWLEQYSTDSQGSQVLAVLVGGEINQICSVHLKVRLDVTRDGETQTKMISTSAEEVHVSGVGTGTSTSNVYKGKNSIENTFGRSISRANNKILMMMNAYFEEVGL